MTTATGRLTDCLPKDPTNDGPIGIADSADLRAVLTESEAVGHARVVATLHDGGELSIVIADESDVAKLAQRINFALREPDHALTLNGADRSLVIPGRAIRFVRVEPDAPA